VTISQDPISISCVSDGEGGYTFSVTGGEIPLTKKIRLPRAAIRYRVGSILRLRRVGKRVGQQRRGVLRHDHGHRLQLVSAYRLLQIQFSANRIRSLRDSGHRHDVQRIH